jgi:hypothetical protein
MIERVRFFVASLWAPLIPVGMLVLGCLSIVLFPIFKGEAAEVARRGAGVALILVPFVYTGFVVVSYGVARALYALRVLSRVALLVTYGVLALLVALLCSWLSATVEFSAGASMRAFVIILIAGLIGGEIAAWVWWRVASHTPPPAEPGSRHRKRKRRHRSEEQSEA